MLTFVAKKKNIKKNLLILNNTNNQILLSRHNRKLNMSILNLNNPNLGINEIDICNTKNFNTSKYRISNYLINAMNYDNILLSKDVDKNIASNFIPLYLFFLLVIL